jgi:alanyl-tRNA synthetase
LKANEWFYFALTSIGGKGGGKPGLAQGSVANSSEDQLDIILDQSNDFVKQTVK